MSEQLIKFNNITHHFNQRDLFYDLSGGIDSGDKIGLIGRNGSGKTTFLKILMGEIGQFRGSVENQSRDMGYIPQVIDITKVPEEISLYEFCFFLHPTVYPEFKVITAFEQGANTDQERYLDAMGEFQEKNGYEYQNDINTFLSIAGFKSENNSQQFKTLSEGQKRLIYLVSMLALNKDLLILDEPTNHVDSILKQRYIKLIREYKGAVLVVSHDRELLSQACNIIWEIEDKALEVYYGNWEMYKEEHPKRLKEKAEKYKSRHDEYERMLDLLERKKKGEAHLSWQAAKTRVRHAEQKLIKVKPTTEKVQIKASLNYEGKYSQFMLRLKEFNLEINGNRVINDLNLEVLFGEKIALTGPNGTGKSTILKLILGICEYASYSGEIVVGNSAQIGYFSQTLELGDEDVSLMEYIRELFKCDKTKAYGLATKYLFDKVQVEQKLYQLSGGEKNRLQLMKLIEGNYNLLLLDEPTNHLDLDSIEKLEEILSSFNGTILLVSHDRYFVEAVAEQELDLGEY